MATVRDEIEDVLLGLSGHDPYGDERKAVADALEALFQRLLAEREAASRGSIRGR